MKIFNETLLKDYFYTTSYFTKTKQILIKDKNLHHATMQFKSFSTTPYMVCGVDEIITILKTIISPSEFAQLKIFYLPDGTIVQPNECVLSINGPYVTFCEFENVFDSILARRSSVATNCWEMLQLIKPEQLLFMSDRSDDYQLQPFDGYAAYLAGVRKFSNSAHTSLLKQPHNASVVGTMPHALIQQYDGDIVKTLHAYRSVDQHNVTVLIDFDNDVIHTLEQLIPHFHLMHGIRIDTSMKLIDKSLLNLQPQNEMYGVNLTQVNLVRQYLDKHNGQHIKIIISSGISHAIVQKFVAANAPVDGYGIGSDLTKLSLHFTADLVKLDNKLCAKFGRQYISEKNMKLYGK